VEHPGPPPLPVRAWTAWKRRGGRYAWHKALRRALGRWPGLTRSEKLRGPLARSGLLNRIPLTPEGVPLAEAIDAIQRLLDEGHILFSLSFHTPSVVPGHTPYVKDAEDLRLFWSWWEGVFELFARHNVTPVRSGDIYAAAASA